MLHSCIAICLFASLVICVGLSPAIFVCTHRQILERERADFWVNLCVSVLVYTISLTRREGLVCLLLPTWRNYGRSLFNMLALCVCVCASAECYIQMNTYANMRRSN